MLQDQYLDDTRQGGLGVGDTKEEIKNINHDQGV